MVDCDWESRRGVVRMGGRFDLKNTRTSEAPERGGGCARLDSSVERTILSMESGAEPLPLDNRPAH